MPDFGIWSAWSSRKLIALPIPTANLTDFPVEVPIVADADIGAKCRADGFDLIFVALDEVTKLPYERDPFSVVGGEATGLFWAKSNATTAGTYIWCYYGNAAAADISEVVRLDLNIYVADAINHRIVKRLASDLSYVNQVGTIGAGNDQFDQPAGVCFDGTYIYVADINNYRIVKRLASDLSYIGQVGTIGAGNDQFDQPIGVCFDGTHIYVVDQYNHRIVKRLASDLSYVSQIGTEGSGDDQFEYPAGACSESAPGRRSADWIIFRYDNMSAADGGLTWGEEQDQSTFGGGSNRMKMKMKMKL